MKDVNLKVNENSVLEDTKQVGCDSDSCACSPEFGCKNCEDDGVPQED